MNPEQKDRNSCRRSDEDRNSHGSSGIVARSTSEESEKSDEVLKYINQMLMEEEDLKHNSCMFYDWMALQATEKYFYDALNEPRSNRFSVPGDAFSPIWSTGGSSESSNPRALECCPVQLTHLDDAFRTTFQSNREFFGSSSGYAGDVNGRGSSLGSVNRVQDLLFSGQFDSGTRGARQVGYFLPNGDVVYDLETNEKFLQLGAEERVKNQSPNSSTGKKHREESDSAEEIRSNKLLASSANESAPLETYDNLLLSANSNNPNGEEEHILCSSPKAQTSGPMSKMQKNEQSKSCKQSRPRAGKRRGIVREVVDLRSLLMQCAQAVANYDNRTADVLLRRIRQHSSPLGDATERLAHYFSNALEARLIGSGTSLFTSFCLKKFSVAEALKGYEAYITACPFKRMSSIYANKCIDKLARSATSLHIVDFGILYGFQWPSLIQSLSERPGGPPQLRITGIDFPQAGFRPAERIEETGRRLANYCRKFNVPFKYNPIAKKWNTIQLKDLLILRGEVLVVNCLYRLDNVLDESVLTSSPRDAVLNLIRSMNPDIFIHGVINGTYNSLFYESRFREALFHFSSLFDMFDASLPRENQARILFEKEVYGRDAINIIACEGTARVERPETYKQWQVRNVRAGFRQLPLDKEFLSYVRDKVKMCYHKDFMVDEDGNWMLQGWKGKVIKSLSCWEPNKKQQQYL